MKVCIITSTRADFGLLKNLIIGLKRNEKFKTKIIASGSHLSKNFGYTYREIEKSGIKISARIKCKFVNDEAVGISKVMSSCIIQTSKILKKLSSDLIIILGDRYEIFGAAISTFINNIPIIHLHGGELTLSAQDDAFRHSITKMSTLHFVSHEIYRKRVIQLGENPKRVFCVGPLVLDNLVKDDFYNNSVFTSKQAALLVYGAKLCRTPQLMSFTDVETLREAGVTDT